MNALLLRRPNRFSEGRWGEAKEIQQAIAGFVDAEGQDNAAKSRCGMVRISTSGMRRSEVKQLAHMIEMRIYIDGFAISE